MAWIFQVWMLWAPMILKIAAGVFLGIIAVLIALKIPAWIVERRAMRVILAFTPDTAIARCGKPASDNEHTFHTVSLRDMAYEGTAGKVILHFGKIDKAESFKFHYSTSAEGLLLASLGLPGTIADSVFEVFMIIAWRN